MCRYLVALLDQRNCEIAVEQNGEDAIRRAVRFSPMLRSLDLSCRGSMEARPGLGF